MTAFAWIIAIIALGVATLAPIFARRAAASAGDPVAPGPVADDPDDEARLSAVFAALPVECTVTALPLKRISSL